MPRELLFMKWNLLTETLKIFLLRLSSLPSCASEPPNTAPQG